jgi:segregation and condensation protein A
MTVDTDDAGAVPGTEGTSGSERAMGSGEASGSGGASGSEDAPRAAAGFEVHLDVFEGPFDLLLALISKHKLDIT